MSLGSSFAISSFSSKRVKCSAILSFSTKTTQPRPQGFSDAVPFSGDYSVLLTSFFGYRNVFQIWSTLAGKEDLFVEFEPITNGQNILRK